MKPSVMLVAVVLCLCPNLSCAIPQNNSSGEDEIDKAKVLVLATPHLRQYKDSFNKDALEPLLAALEHYNPDIVAVEQLSYESILSMQNQGSVMEPVLEQFGRTIISLAELARKELGNTTLTDRSNVETLPGGVKSKSVDRRSLAFNLAAAGDRMSALLQWRIFKSSAAKSDVTDTPLTKELDAGMQSINETISIGLELAFRCGLTKIYNIDDHSDKDQFMAYAGDLMAELQNSQVFDQNMLSQYANTINDDVGKCFNAGSVLPVYLKMNSPEWLKKDLSLQWNLFQRTRLPSGNDRRRLASWDIRNLSIVANIRRAMAEQPGGKVLVIIGASHKPFLDDLLDSLIDVEVIHLQDIINDIESLQE